MAVENQPWMRPYVMSIVGLLLEQSFARIAEALARENVGAAQRTISEIEQVIQAEIAGMGDQDEIPLADLIVLRQQIHDRMASVFARARQGSNHAGGARQSG